MTRFLQAVAVFILFAGCLHAVLGLGAEAMLGVKIPPEMLNEPSLNSQDRFYGAAFVLYGLLLWLCIRDMQRFAPVFRLLLIVFFFAGLTRVLSVILHGWPAPMIVALAASELILPPALLFWHSRRWR
jgi:hypothetical protein